MALQKCLGGYEVVLILQIVPIIPCLTAIINVDPNAR